MNQSTVDPMGGQEQSDQPEPGQVAAAARRALIAEQLAGVRRRLDTAMQAAGRTTSSVRLIAVSKTVSQEAVRIAYALGLADFGENRVAELVAKRQALPAACWHMVGQLQRNKAREVVDGRTLIHSVDRARLVATIDRLAQERDVIQPVLVQVNVGDDPAKGGCRVNEVAALVAYAAQLTNVQVEGLMTVPPLAPPGSDPNAHAAPYFATLRRCREDVADFAPDVRELSMGMSADVEAAVGEGATMVRIGTAIFGRRPVPEHRQEEQR